MDAQTSFLIQSLMSSAPTADTPRQADAIAITKAALALALLGAHFTEVARIVKDAPEEQTPDDVLLAIVSEVLDFVKVIQTIYPAKADLVADCERLTDLAEELISDPLEGAIL